MSSEYLAYTLIGVPASKFIKDAEISITYPKYLHEDIYDKDGNRLMAKRDVYIFRFDNKTFEGKDTYPYLSKYIPNLEKESLPKYIRDIYKLEWISYDYTTVWEKDVFGLVISKWGDNGVGYFNLPELYVKAISLFQKLDNNIDMNELRIYTGFYHSY